MEKNLYESYELLPAADGGEAVADQYFVVHNDGTLMINRPVQYVTQDSKEGLQSVQPVVFDASQQYYIDVENSTELLAVSDQFVIPETGNNVYGSNYILHTLQDAAAVQATDNIIPKTETSMSVEPETVETAANVVQIPENTNCTEITINDEQYRKLEEKGWVLIELADKIFLLNTLGLHDITENEKLIQELKSETQSEHMSSDTGREEKVNISTYSMEEMATDNKMAREQDTVRLIFGENTVVNMDEGSVGNTVQEQMITNGQDDNEASNAVSDISETASKETIAPQKQDYPSNCTIVRLKTSFSLKDIPKNIVLGKTPSGKRLVAKVVDVKRTLPPPCDDRQPKPDDHRDPGKETGKKPEVHETYYKEADVERLIERHMGETAEPLCCSAEDVSGAEIVIKQLLIVATTRAPLMGRNLLVTKIVKTLDVNNRVALETGPVLVTGRVAQLDGPAGEWHFIYVPHLLQKLSEDVDGWLVFPEAEETERQAQFRTRDNCLLHVHIVETKHPTAPTNTSIVFSKRRARAPSNKKVEAFHACRTCAKLFKTEEQLQQHLMFQCLEREDRTPMLVIDTGKISDKLVKNNVEGTTKKSCPLCQLKVKGTNFNKHLSSHFGKKSTDEKSLEKDLESQDFKNLAKYKCKMCPTAYAYASSLSKHILTQHIKSKLQIVTE